MTRRLEIELTSARHDGTWTWRAAGAREPRGVIEGKLLEDGARVGAVLRVEAEIELEGITVVSVLPARERVASQDRIELAPTKLEEAGLVTTSLVSRSGRGARERPFDGNGRGRTREKTAPSRPRGESRPRADEPERRRPSRERDLSRGPVRDGAPRRVRPTRARPEDVVIDQAAGAPTPAVEPTATRRSRLRPERSVEPTATRRSRPRPERFIPGTRHRDEYLANLPPEQRAVADQVAAGGMPAVRRALAAEQSAALAAGRPPVGGEAIIALAEQLLPPVRQAVWLDRAEAVAAQLETISLRELRATVLGASPRDGHGRELLGTFREALKTRLAKLREGWEGDINRALGEGRVLHALRLSARPPDPGARIPGSLVAPLSEAGGAGLSAASSVDRWLALLEAAAASPVRRSVKPAGLPDDPSGAVRRAAILVAGRIPALAPLLGLPMPPPPRPVPAHPMAQAAKPRRGRAPRTKSPRSAAKPAGTERVTAAEATATAAEEDAPPDELGTSLTSTALALVVEQAQLGTGEAAAAIATDEQPASDEPLAEGDRSSLPGDESPGTLSPDNDPQGLDPAPSSDERDDPEPAMTGAASADGDAVVPEPLAEAVDEV
ncbi:MAG: hypothetical protein WB383_02475 [Acidimicrobiales bacterium]